MNKWLSTQAILMCMELYVHGRLTSAFSEGATLSTSGTSLYSLNFSSTDILRILWPYASAIETRKYTAACTGQLRAADVTLYW